MSQQNETVTQQREFIVLRVIWMLLYLVVWQVAQWVLGAVVLAQLCFRLFTGSANGCLLSFGDSLSQFLAQIGQFGTFNTEQKPWPFSAWPQASGAIDDLEPQPQPQPQLEASDNQASSEEEPKA